MPSYATGPSHRTSGPVVAAYAEGDAIGRPCTNCGAGRDSWCKRPDGSFKPVPCCTRLRGGNAGPDGLGAQRGAEMPATTQGEQLQ